MTLYDELVDLKYRRGFATHELIRRFPGQIERVSEVALLHIPDETLKEVIPEQDILQRLLDLKRQYVGMMHSV
ncbi:MAG TPA: hypothetical protein PLL75_02230 [Candidatus Omnitrophota bacterium]|nr:hypothetical protein [Candidatus Omnitrophota bacterium]HPS36529.1 hypothetical protein [Candidatus Omnitrophota bacterium]